MRVGPLPDIGNEPLSCTRRLKRSRIRTFLGSTDQNNVDKSSFHLFSLNAITVLKLINIRIRKFQLSQSQLSLFLVVY